MSHGDAAPDLTTMGKILGGGLPVGAFGGRAEVMQKLADTRPIGIGSMGAGASGMRGRDPGAAQGAASSGASSGADAHARSAGRPPRDPNSFGFPVWQLKEGEDKMIAARLVEIFSAVRRT